MNEKERDPAVRELAEEIFREVTVEDGVDGIESRLRAFLDLRDNEVAHAWNEELDAEFPPAPGGVPYPVLVARMIRQGASYDHASGIWWSDDSKPGVLEQAEAESQSLRGALENLLKTFGLSAEDTPNSRGWGPAVRRAQAALSPGGKESP